MKRNKEFQKFLELKEKYIAQPSKSLLEEVQEEVGFLIPTPTKRKTQVTSFHCSKIQE